MASVLWTLSVLLVLFWIIGLVGHIGGSLIHAALVVAIILGIVNVLTGRRVV